MVDTSTQNPLPVVGPSYNDQLLTFLSAEDANRFTDMLNPFVVANGLHGTGGGLTGNPGNTVAYPEGFYTTETSSILYPDNTANNWVILFKDIVTDPGGNWVQVAGTHYWIDSVSGSQPAEPAGSLILMRVTTSGGSITVVDDLRNLNAFTTAGDRVKITISDTTARFLAAALVEGTNVTLTVLNPGADETLQVATTDAKVTITTNDTTEGVLNDKILVTAPLTKTTNNPGANETLTFDLNLIDTVNLADNGVTLAKIAHGTADRVHGTDNSGIPVLAQLVEAQIANDAVNWDTAIKAAAIGDVAIWDSNGNSARLTKQNDGDQLTLVSGVPAWASPKNMEVFTSSGTWTWPGSVAVVFVELAGAGGGGGSTTNTGDEAGGGGGGEYVRALIPVTGDLTITINALGSGGTAGGNGGNGGTTQVDDIVADGGDGGDGGNDGPGGAGGTEGSDGAGNTVLLRLKGTSGAAGTGGFGGSGGRYGENGLWDDSKGQFGNGVDAVGNGLGGSGAGGGTDNDQPGGDGGIGFVIIWW